MREFVRPIAAVLGVACLAAAIATASAGDALAQAKEVPPQQTAPAAQAAPVPAQLPAAKQIALTDKQIEGVLAAQKDMDAITAKLVDTPSRIPRWPRSSRASPGRTVLPVTTNTAMSSTHQHRARGLRSGD